jgi:hypothetical protein
MATFAKINILNEVVNIIKVGNDVPTSAGPLGENDMHVDGETYCQNLFGGQGSFTYKQSSFTGSFRGKPAQIGGTYDPVKDIFIPAKPEAGMVLNADGTNWEYPIPFPSTQNWMDGELSKQLPISYDESIGTFRTTLSSTGTAQNRIWNKDTLVWE